TDERRKKASGGVSGWVAGRAGKWTLEGMHDRWMERQKYFWNPLADYWFRMEVEGWEHLPDPPVLLIGVHSGAPSVRDAWTVGVPIVPIATVGGPDAMPILATGRRLARWLRLDRVARLKVFPISLSAPWGISPAVLPEIPFPTKIRTAFQEPIELGTDPELAED